MFKKVLVIVCAMSVMVMTGCGMLGGVSQKDYEMATADRDMYMNDYLELAEATYDLEDEIVDLESEIETLEADILALEEEIAAAEAGAMDGDGEVVIHEITDEVALKIQLPEGFSYYGDGMYKVGASDPSNITIRSAQTSDDGLNFTQETLEQSILYSYESMGYDVEDFEFSTYESGEIKGYETLFMEISYSLNGINLQQIEFIIQVEDMTCTVLYTTEESTGWYDEFIQSVDSIQIGKK